MKIIIGGALGRMGKELAGMATDAGEQIVCGVDVAYQGQEIGFPLVNEYALITAGADVLIDFSRADGLPALLTYALAARMPLVLCATGYSEAEQRDITKAAETLPILQSANMSLGISVMRQLAVIAARALGDGYDVEIIEKHHRRKLDSPSGTALMFYDAVRQAKGGTVRPVYGRQGLTQQRTNEEIGLHAVRGGTVAGEHEIGFYGNGEEILLTHRAENRALFAQGALRAARFLAGKPAGRYTMEDVVGEMLS
ncbi:MAG: 4-hydroxy-tetrahydrodipicolinate reductase [Eubacteriales bacterium]|nr:4-hydroxy-tetrahydrodipicolinate reductase [Eubacteriales bacterium]